MEKNRFKGIGKYSKPLLITGIITLAALLNQIFQRTTSIYINRGTGILRSLIYFIFFASWGLSIRKRLIQKQARMYLMRILGLIVFWLGLRTIKYFFIYNNSNLFRYLWYSYYIPEILILLFSVFVTLSLGERDDYTLPGSIKLLYLPSLALIILVLTNDFHEKVFKFGQGASRKNVSYSHQLGFWLIFIWLILTALVILYIMIMKSKTVRSKQRILLPFIPVIIAVIYTLIYVFDFGLIKIIANDMTVVNCLLIVSFFEACIKEGLIRVNKYYDYFFYESSISAIITDRDYNTIYKSKMAANLDKNILRSAENSSQLIDKHTRLSSKPINGGHILWLEDIKEINQVVSSLKEVRDSLLESNEILQAEIELKERQTSIEEKERIYSKIIQDIGPRLEFMDKLLGQDINKLSEKEILKKLLISGIYIKRRSNLIIINQDSQILYAKELEYCFRETVEGLVEAEIEAYLISNCQGSLSAKLSFLIYDIFQDLLELSLDKMESCLVNLKIIDEQIEFKILLSNWKERLELENLKTVGDIRLRGGHINQILDEDNLYLNISFGKVGKANE